MWGQYGSTNQWSDCPEHQASITATKVTTHPEPLPVNGPLRIFHFKHLTLWQMLLALCHPKQLNQLEVSTALAFVIGPILFAIGSLWSITNPDAAALSSATLALGSVFFFAGGWWQLRQAKLAIKILPADVKDCQWCGLRCALTQSMGTMLFNINTFFLWG